MEKQTFILFTENKSLVDKLSDEQAGKLIKAVFQYECDDTFPDFSDDLALSLVFDVMKRQLDYSREKYEIIKEKRKEAANRRWQNTKNSSNTAKDTNECKSIQTDANACKCIQKDANECKSMQMLYCN